MVVIAVGRRIKQRRQEATPQSIPPISASTDSSQKTLFNPGLNIMDFDFNNSITGKKEKITAAVWYPTDAEPQSFVYHDSEDLQSKVALDAPISKKAAPYPLIIFSHGAFGSGYNTAYFMEYLARQGYIAVAPDYIDTAPPKYEEEIAFSRIKTGKTFSNLQVLRAAKEFVDDANAEVEFMFSYMEKHRLNHTSFVIDQITALNRDPSSDFYQTINEEAIGMAGHSLGGLTTLAKTGAYPKPGYTDERIKAALLFSAPAHPFENTVNQIDIPIMFMVGDNDEPNYGPKDVPRRAVYDSAVSPKYLLIIKNSTHFTFGNSGCGE
ncbi:dienelactone hydrolase family protein, partial [Patescibacteria group bacterium]|nr:dienelactone hydrolase family protein [Patescibacteria group bacterium]